MPKFMTYKRPAPVNKQVWNHAPGRKAEVPRKASVTTAADMPPLSPFVLQQLLRKN